MTAESSNDNRLRIGMVGLGMIFDETYRPLFEQLCSAGLYRHDFGSIAVELVAVASRSGRRAGQWQKTFGGRIQNFSGEQAATSLGSQELEAVCIASPDDRHFEAARAALAAGKHVLIEKPSVLRLPELDELLRVANERGVLAKVVYHKLFDPDHKALRTKVADGVLQHVNNGYCSLLEPKRISRDQFAEWIVGRNPGTYVAVHYLKLIDFTFGPTWQMRRIAATGQRGLAGATDSTTWDSVQLQVVYEHPDGREAAFDIHTSWVAPDEFPGSVEQEVQFRFDNGVWNAHQRKRGVECVVEGRSPSVMPAQAGIQEMQGAPWFPACATPNHHYNADCLEPWGERRRRGYGLEAIRRFFEEVAFVEFGGSLADRTKRLNQMRGLTYNDLSADRNVVAAVQGMEAILSRHAAGKPGGIVKVNAPCPGLWLFVPGQAEPECLYGQTV